MKYPLLGIMLAVLSKSLISSAQEPIQTSSAVLTTTTTFATNIAIATATATPTAIATTAAIATTTTIVTTTTTNIITTTSTATVTPYLAMPIAFANITSVSAPECNAYAALIIQCQPSIPTTATTQTQKDLPLLQCLCHAGTFYSVYTNCTTSMNLTSAWNATQFSQYCQYIDSGNITLLSNGSITPTGMNNGTLMPLIITVVTYISKASTTLSTPSIPFPTSVSAATTISDSIVARLSCTLLMAWTMMMVISHTLATPQLFY